MKVVLFCGGLGMRMRTGEDPLPKPMSSIGSRPMLWHIMRYYAHFGHTEFILCLGYGGHVIKDYFLNYEETTSNDFVLSQGGAKVEPLNTDITDWTITFVDTGHETPIGERLRRVRRYLGDDEMFLANYGDGLSNVDMDDLVARLPDTHVGSLLAVSPQDSFHVVGISPEGNLTGLEAVADLDMRINGGFFVLRQSIFDYFDEGEDLVTHACLRAAAEGRFAANRFDGFWACMDTVKERNQLEELNRSNTAPWKVWLPGRPTHPASDPAPAPIPD
ncbi:glucose-1-phosphate cytidylyltransferase [Propionicicella superfundia]|uniref:glucose-1-phosphate cytidylyltransferase n=1 Tax=Propionicicella superfundia TaxID=348582 RepID=UPI00040D993E|nr:glucose-1-phosphate cytidylyltransferase [Propionicicella superfundia]